MIIYGIKNCDTVKRARYFLDTHTIHYRFHDVRQDGITEEMLQHWCNQCPWETLINKKSTTWRQLSDHEKETITDSKTAIALMLAHPTVIKRPVLDTKTRILVGFNTSEYDEVVKQC